MRLFLFILFISTSFLTQAAAIVDIGQLQLVVEPASAPVQPIDLGQDVRRGVVARVQLEPQPLGVNSAGHGGPHSYLLSVSFVESETGTLLLEGQVAARMSSEDRRIAGTLRLEPQENNWSGLLTLPAEGETLIRIGSKLSDGKKRIYRFFYNPRPAPQLLEGGEGL